MRLNRSVSCAALGVKKAQQFLERVGIGGIPKERALPVHVYEIFVLELVQMMRQRGGGNIQLCADITRNHALRVCRKQQPHDTKAGLGPHG